MNLNERIIQLATAIGNAIKAVGDALNLVEQDLEFFVATPTRAALEATSVDAKFHRLKAMVGPILLEYVRDENGTSLTTADGATWSPASMKTVWHWGVVGDGVTDDSVELTKAFTWCNDNKVRLHDPLGGTFLLNDRIEYNSVDGTTQVWMDFVGNGSNPDSTQFVVNNDDGAMSFTKVGALFYCRLKDFRVTITSNRGLSGDALTFTADQTGAPRKHALEVDNVLVETNDLNVVNTGGVNDITNPSYFSHGFVLNQICRPIMRNTIVTGPKQFMGEWIAETATLYEWNAVRYGDGSVNYLMTAGFKFVDCYGIDVRVCGSYSCETGFVQQSLAKPIEAGSFLEFTCVNVKIGLLRENLPGSPAGIEPGGRYEPAHINYRDIGLSLAGMKYAEIRGGLWYCQNTAYPTVGSSNPLGVLLVDGGGHTIEGVTIASVDNVSVLVRHEDVTLAGEGELPFVASSNVSINPMDVCFQVLGSEAPSVDASNLNSNEAVFVEHNGATYTAPYNKSLQSGLYVPPGTGVLNVESHVFKAAYYQRVGDVVSISGVVNINPVAANTLTELEFDAPIEEGIAFLTGASDDIKAVGTVSVVRSGEVGYGTLSARDGKLLLTYMAPTSTNAVVYFSGSYGIYR